MPLENPYRNGAYFFTIAALIKLGLNKSHKFGAFVAKLRQVWSAADAEGWKAFENRKPRNKETAKDLDGRIMQNCRVLQRVKDYGRPLLKAGAVLDMPRDKTGVLHVALNTHSRKPQKPGRAPKPAAKQAKPAKPKAGMKRKPSKDGKRAGRATVKAAGPTPPSSATPEPTTATTESQPKAE
jgi:hypothetical protein